MKVESVDSVLLFEVVCSRDGVVSSSRVEVSPPPSMMVVSDKLSRVVSSIGYVPMGFVVDKGIVSSVIGTAV